MLNRSPEKHINRKVAVGFLLLIAVAAITLGLNYVNTINYINKNLGYDPIAERLILLNEFVFRIQEYDGAARMYNVSGLKKHHNTYQNKTDSVLTALQKIENTFRGTNFQSQLDTIRFLFESKKTNTEELIELSTINRYRQRYGEILPILPDSINLQVEKITYSSLHLDSTKNIPPKPSKKNFLDRIADFLQGNNNEIPPRVESPEILQRIDSSKITRRREYSALSQVKQQVEKIQKQDKRFASLLQQREQKLTEINNKLTNAIRHIINSLENQVVSESERNQQSLALMKKELLERLAIPGIASLVIILLFIIWIGNDLRKSQNLKEELIRSREKIESLMKVKERFLANMSHEIRTPLTAITGFSELRKNHDETAAIIHNSAIHLLTLVNDVLDLTTLEAGKITLNEEPTDPKELFHEVIQTFKQKAEKKNIDLSFKIDSDVLPFNIDKTRLRQILFNLTGNAIKFTEKGKVWITLKTIDNQLLFEVNDTGCGISQSQQEDVFEEFTRLHPSESTKNGSGLGLSISKKLVVAMNGKIGVNSCLNKGSTFWFSLPYQPHISINTEDRDDLSFLNQKNIIVIDDDPLIGQLIKGYLKEQAIVEISHSPSEALKLIRKKNFDLIITDLRMPEYDGIEFLKKIRKQNRVPVLLLSAAMNDNIINTLSHHSNVYCMPKPFSGKDLKYKLYNITEARQQPFIKEPEQSSNSSLFDLSGISAFTGDDHDFFISVVTSFIKDTDQNLSLLTTFIRNKQYNNIPDQAHKMLTGFRQFGIKDGAAILKSLEITAKYPGSYQELRRALKRLKSLWQVVKKELKKQI